MCNAKEYNRRIKLLRFYEVLKDISGAVIFAGAMVGLLMVFNSDFEDELEIRLYPDSYYLIRFIISISLMLLGIGLHQFADYGRRLQVLWVMRYLDSIGELEKRMVIK